MFVLALTDVRARPSAFALALPLRGIRVSPKQDPDIFRFLSGRLRVAEPERNPERATEPPEPGCVGTDFLVRAGSRACLHWSLFAASGLGPSGIPRSLHALVRDDGLGFSHILLVRGSYFYRCAPAARRPPHGASTGATGAALSRWHEFVAGAVFSASGCVCVFARQGQHTEAVYREPGSVKFAALWRWQNAFASMM